MKKCNVKSCDRNAKRKGLCDAHYARARRGAPMDAPIGAPPSGRPRRLPVPVAPERALPVNAEPADCIKCLACGKTFPPPSGNLKLFCSSTCRMRYNRYHGRVALGVREFDCAGCGAHVFTDPENDFRYRFCSETCRRAWRDTYRKKSVGQSYGGIWRIKRDSQANKRFMEAAEKCLK